MEIDQSISLPLPPDDIFEFREEKLNSSLRLAQGQGYSYFPDHYEFIPGEGGKLYYRGYKEGAKPAMPQNRVEFAPAIIQLEALKRWLRVSIQFLSSRSVRWMILPFVIAPKNVKANIITEACKMFNEESMVLFGNWYLKDEYMTPLGIEIARFFIKFLVQLGVPEHEAYRVGKTIAHIFEQDRAYAYRLLDMGSEVWKEHFYGDMPCEVVRLAKILESREDNPEGMKFKYDALVKVIKYAWRIPSTRKALKTAAKGIIWESLQLSENDIYHSLLYGSYNVRGKSFEERMKIYEAYHGSDQSKWPLRWALGNQ